MINRNIAVIYTDTGEKVEGARVSTPESREQYRDYVYECEREFKQTEVLR